jgi:hypothetical protein
MPYEIQENPIARQIRIEQGDAAEEERKNNHVMRCRYCGWVGTQKQIEMNSIGSGKMWCPGKGIECTCSDWETISDDH